MLSTREYGDMPQRYSRVLGCYTFLTCTPLSLQDNIFLRITGSTSGSRNCPGPLRRHINVQEKCCRQSGLGNMHEQIYMQIWGLVSLGSEVKGRISQELSSFRSVGPGGFSKTNINTKCGRPSASRGQICSLFTSKNPRMLTKASGN